MITTKGIVIKERPIGDNDKYLDILTEDLGVIEVRARSSKKLNSKSFAACNIYTYSKYCLREYKGKYYIDSTYTITSYFGIATDIEKLALVVYFADILKNTGTDREESKRVLEIFIQTLNYLEYDLIPIEQVKAVFEWLVMSAIGYRPDTGNCAVCGSDFVDYFSVEQASLFCEDCKPEGSIFLPVPTLIAMRYILVSELNKAFMFRLKKQEYLDVLAKVTQKYVFYHLDMPFQSLDYYHKIKSKG